MRKNIFVFMILGTCVSLPAFADYTIGNFVAPKGADGINGINGTNGTDCRPTETRTRCYGTGSSKCDDSTRSGVKIVTTQCDGSGSTTSYIYDNNCGITVASTTDVHQDNDTTKPVTHKRVTFKNTCTNETLSTTADVPVGCTPTYTQKYINKETNGSFTYNNDSRTERTIGARVTVSGCGNDNSFDTYDGNDGTSFNYKGSVANCSALNSVSNPSQNDAYIVNGDGNGKLCIYNGSSWPTCPSGCAEFTGPAGDNNCTGYEDSNTAVKHTLRTYSGPSDSTTSNGITFYTTRGKMVLTHKMCNTNLTDTVDNENDPCVPIIAPSGVTCNGTYMECKRGDNSTTYNVCEATTGTTFSSALSDKEDAVCVGTNANSPTVEKEKTVSYTAPTGSGSYGTYSWKTAVGKVVNKSVKCNNSETTISSTPDKCEEIVKPNGVCAENGKVYYKCTQQNDGTEYDLCADGNSVLGAAQIVAQSAAETAVAVVDPCASVANGSNDQKKAQIKSLNSTYTLQTVSNGDDRTVVGYSTVTKTTCATGADATQVEYQYDTCKEIADTRTSGACSGSNKVYLECVNQTKGADAIDRAYKVCQTVTANTSLTSKINGKADASAVTQSALADTLGSTYLKPSDTISASQLPSNVVTTTDGKINAGVLPSTVVTIGDDATHGFNTLLGNSVSTAVSTAISTEISNGSQGVFKDFVTNGNLTTTLGGYVTTGALDSAVENAVDDATFTFASQSLKLSEIVYMLNQAVGTCNTTTTDNGARVQTSCSGGALGNINLTRSKEE